MRNQCTECVLFRNLEVAFSSGVFYLQIEKYQRRLSMFWKIEVLFYSTFYHVSGYCCLMIWIYLLQWHQDFASWICIHHSCLEFYVSLFPILLHKWIYSMYTFLLDKCISVHYLRMSYQHRVRSTIMVRFSYPLLLANWPKLLNNNIVATKSHC